MNFLFRRRGPAAGVLLSLMIATTAACSSASSPNRSAAPTTSPGPSTSLGTNTGAPTGTQACHSTTSGTAGAGSGDALVPGDIPDTQHFVTFHSTDGYHLDYPEGWARTTSGSAATFTDKFNSVRVDSTVMPSAPSIASAQTSDVAALAASAPCFRAGKVTSVTRKAGSAILIAYQSESPADPVTGKVVIRDVERYEFWQAGKLVTITLSSPKGSDNVDPWRQVTDSFAWGS